MLILGLFLFIGIIKNIIVIYKLLTFLTSLALLRRFVKFRLLPNIIHCTILLIIYFNTVISF